MDRGKPESVLTLGDQKAILEPFEVLGVPGRELS